jgi:hypothetical protein
MSTSSDRFQVVVLCEDGNHYHFVRGFVMKKHANATFVPRMPAPGHGSGRAYVERHFHREVVETRKRTTRARTRLVVVVDGDNDTLLETARKLESVSYQGATDENHVVVAIPRRNIETWMSHAAGHSVDETTNFKRPGGVGITAKKAGETLAQRMPAGGTNCDHLPTLQSASERYREVFEGL